MLLPPLADSGEDDSNLIHSIIWPILGGVLLFVLLVLLLYFVSSHVVVDPTYECLSDIHEAIIQCSCGIYWN